MKSSLIPHHVAIIMDGNGRWAAKEGKERVEGHTKGVEALRRAVQVARKQGVRYLTVYAFSTENWGRPQQEVDAIMELFSRVVIKEAKELAQNNIALRFIGDTKALSTALQEQIVEVESMGIIAEMTLVVAINYSARWDIMQATQRLVNSTVQDIKEEDFKAHLSTAKFPDVDLVIRTSGEQRLSNFLLWESSYAELYFTERLWPEFDKNDFNAALEWYVDRDRRFGVRK
ncbi:MAG: polyprenyl diphosphate synthase [Rikenellaceae bacterium]